MIELHVAVIIGFICVCLGAAFMALCFKSSATNNMVQDIIDRAKAIPGKVEEIIEVLMDEGYVETGRTEGDYDLNVSQKGTEDIEKILEGL